MYIKNMEKTTTITVKPVVPIFPKLEDSLAIIFAEFTDKIPIPTAEKLKKVFNIQCSLLKLNPKTKKSPAKIKKVITIIIFDKLTFSPVEVTSKLIHPVTLLKSLPQS